MKFDAFEQFAAAALIASLLGLWFMHRSLLEDRVGMPQRYLSTPIFSPVVTKPAPRRQPK